MNTETYSLFAGPLATRLGVAVEHLIEIFSKQAVTSAWFTLPWGVSAIILAAWLIEFSGRKREYDDDFCKGLAIGLIWLAAIGIGLFGFCELRTALMTIVSPEAAAIREIMSLL